MRGYADLILAGRILRGLAGGFATAPVIRDGLVLAAGDRGLPEGMAGPDARRVVLDGRVAIPAFDEAHMHHLTPRGSVPSWNQHGAMETAA